jgi:hypothetical protein
MLWNYDSESFVDSIEVREQCNNISKVGLLGYEHDGECELEQLIEWRDITRTTKKSEALRAVDYEVYALLECVMYLRNFCINLLLYLQGKGDSNFLRNDSNHHRLRHEIFKSHHVKRGGSPPTSENLHIEDRCPVAIDHFLPSVTI